MRATWTISGAVPRTDHLFEKLTNGVAVVIDVSGLASADVGDQCDSQRQIRFLPEIADFTRLAVIAQSEVRECQISHRRAVMIGDRTRDRDQIDVNLNIRFLRRGQQNGTDCDCRNDVSPQ